MPIFQTNFTITISTYSHNSVVFYRSPPSQDTRPTRILEFDPISYVSGHRVQYQRQPS